MITTSSRMVSDGGGGYSGDKSEIIELFNKAITELKSITEEQLRALVKIDDNVSSTSVMMNAITKRIEELEKAKERFETDADKIEKVKERFNL